LKEVEGKLFEIFKNVETRKYGNK